MFANLYIYFICLKLFVKKIQINLNSPPDSVASFYYASKSPERIQLKGSRLPNIYFTKNRKVAPFFETHPKLPKKHYFIHLKGVFSEKMYFTV